MFSPSKGDDSFAVSPSEGGTKEISGKQNDVDGYRLQALSDPAHHILAFRSEYYEGAADHIEFDARTPAGSIKVADLSRVRSARGLRIGSSEDEVINLFGKPRRRMSSCGLTAFAYNAELPDSCPKVRDFVLRQRRVRAIIYDEGC
ncbi:MAG: hypothetical protein NVSMB31_11860 [Vulcanimicrobiaceae bacterium]